MSAMSFMVVHHEEGQTGPVPASGIHAELLAELDVSAHALIKLVELERSGVYDGIEHRFWTVSDPVLNAARRLVMLAEQRAAELRDSRDAASSTLGQR